MLTLWTILSTLLITICIIVNGKNMEQKLLEDLGLKNYDVRIRPVSKHNEAVNVSIGVDIVKILSVEENKGQLTLAMWLRLQWIDQALKWKLENYDNLSSIVLEASSIWRPDIALYNGIEEYAVRQMSKTEVIVENDGTVYWMPSAHLTVSCVILTSLFPFDRHQCDVRWGSWSHDGFAINILPGLVEMQDFEQNPQWFLTDVPKLNRRDIYYECCPDQPYPRVTLTINLSRRSVNYFFGIILPCLVFSFLIILQFIIPPDIGERVVYGIGVLMLLTVFGYYISGFTPQTWPSVPLIAIYIFCLMLGGAAALTFTCLVVNFYHTKFNMTMRPWVKKIFLNYLPKILCMKKEADYAVRQMTLRRKSTMKKPMPDMEPLLDRQTSSKGADVVPVEAAVNPTLPALIEILRDIREMSHVLNLRLAEMKGSPEWKYAAEAVNRLGLFSVTLYLVICHAVVIIYAIASDL